MDALDVFATLRDRVATWDVPDSTLIPLARAVANDLIPEAIKDHEKAPGGAAHHRLVGAALTTRAITDHIIAGRNIQAIQELRTLTNCGLKEAKDAVDAVKRWVAPPF